MGERLCNSDFSFLPLPLVSSVKTQFKLPKSSLVGGQCLDREPFDFNDFSLKLTKYLMFPNSYICVKNLKSSFRRKVKPWICNHNLPPALHNIVAVNQITDKNPLRMFFLLITSTH